MRSSVKKIHLFLSYLGSTLYTGYVAFVFLLLSFPMLLTLFLASRSQAQRLARFWARLYCKSVGWRIHIEGKDNLTSHRPMIFVANHASYIDTLIVTAILPPGVALVGKKELIKVPFIRWMFTKLDHLTVERRDVSQSLVDLAKMEERLREGQSLLLFPEGTFTYVAGLRLFKLGAFKLAVDTQTLICPLAIQGTRYILPDESILMRPNKINITVSPPLKPKNTEWNEVLRLRSVVRQQIAQSCGEPVFDID